MVLAKQAQKVKGRYGEALSALLKLITANEEDLERMRSGTNDLSKQAKQIKKLNINVA